MRFLKAAGPSDDIEMFMARVVGALRTVRQRSRTVAEDKLGKVFPLNGRDVAGWRPTQERNALSVRYRTAVNVCTLAGVAALAAFWTLGPDPAVLIEEESSSLRAELVDLRQVPIEEFVPLTDRSEYRWVLGPGFASPEADGTWVRSRTAQLIFYLPSNGESGEGSRVLELSVSPLLIEGQKSRSLVVRSAVDEVEVNLGPGGDRVFIQLGGGEEQVVELACDSLNAPAGETFSIDMRRLCVKVYAMAVRKGLR